MSIIFQLYSYTHYKNQFRAKSARGPNSMGKSAPNPRKSRNPRNSRNPRCCNNPALINLTSLNASFRRRVSNLCCFGPQQNGVQIYNRYRLRLKTFTFVCLKNHILYLYLSSILSLPRTLLCKVSISSSVP